MIWFDAGIVFLLIAALGFCWKLSDRMQSLKSVTNGLNPSINQLSQVLQRATNAISYLKEASDKSSSSINTHLPKAQDLSEDLKLLIEHADRLSYRLDDLISKAGGVEKDLRQSVMICMRQIEVQKEEKKTNPKITTQVTEINDPRDLFVQRVISRYPNPSSAHENRVELPQQDFPGEISKWQ